MAKRLNFKEIAGKKFSRLTVLSETKPHVTKGGHKHRVALCLCECGLTNEIQVSAVINGITKSCGCLSKEISSKNATINNKVHGGVGTPEYESWNSMKKRCFNKNHKSYSKYGGRGITVCDRWINSYQNFIDDMGLRPEKTYSLDRIEVNGNYEPSNCRWATKKEQSRNTTSNVLITYNGETKCLGEWADILKMSWQALFYRLTIAKWSTEKAFNTPIKSVKND